MVKKLVFLNMLLLIISGIAFAQTSSIRKYVGVINQSYHPSIVDFFEDVKKEMENKGNSDAVKSVDRYLTGPFGTGFVYVNDNGDNYVITNNHVINQAYSLKFTLEKGDGSKTVYEGLKVLAVDEDLDVAVLTFTNNAKPFTAGLAFSIEPVDEGENIFSAGFPGLGGTPIYQFGSGIISNRSTMLPVDIDGEEMIGPFIQHTAPVDPGNSGGPLLISRSGTATNYAVVGINTLKGLRRQSANYAIPAGRALEFITKATGLEQGDKKAALELRINDFMRDARASGSVYEKIAAYLSNACIADNAEYALSELTSGRFRVAWKNIGDEFENDPVSGMKLAVAWLIEYSMRKGGGSISLDRESITAINDSTYTVTFKVNDESVSSTWVLEYGIWRISTFGMDVTGDKTLVEKRAAEKKAESDLFTDYVFTTQAGVVIMPDMKKYGYNEIGYNAGFRVYLLDWINVGSDLTGNGNYNQIHAVLGVSYPIRLGAVAITPFADFSAGLVLAQVKHDNSVFNNSLVPDGGFGWGIKGGLMFTTKFVKGLYLHASYQYSGASLDFTLNENKLVLNNSFITIGLGFGF